MEYYFIYKRPASPPSGVVNERHVSQDFTEPTHESTTSTAAAGSLGGDVARLSETSAVLSLTLRHAVDVLSK